MAEFKDRIEELLKKHNLTYQEFADRVNGVNVSEGARLSKSFIADVVSGKREPRYKTIIRIARAFDISTDYLLGLSDNEQTTNDDINTAIEVTGLSAQCVKLLARMNTGFTKPFAPVYAEYAEVIDFLVKDLYEGGYLEYESCFDKDINEAYSHIILEILRQIFNYNVDRGLLAAKYEPRFSLQYIDDDDNYRLLNDDHGRTLHFPAELIKTWLKDMLDDSVMRRIGVLDKTAEGDLQHNADPDQPPRKKGKLNDGKRKKTR